MRSLIPQEKGKYANFQADVNKKLKTEMNVHYFLSIEFVFYHPL